MKRYGAVCYFAIGALFIANMNSCKSSGSTSTSKDFGTTQIDPCRPLDPQPILDTNDRRRMDQRGYEIRMNSYGNYNARTDFVLALGVHDAPPSEPFGAQGFANWISATLNQPALTHFDWGNVAFSKFSEIPLSIKKGSPEDLNYEINFTKVIENAFQRNKCANKDGYPVIYFNIAGLNPEYDGSIFTVRELKVVWQNPKYLSHTKFFSSFDRLTVDDVRNTYQWLSSPSPGMGQ